MSAAGAAAVPVRPAMKPTLIGWDVSCADDPPPPGAAHPAASSELSAPRTREVPHLRLICVMSGPLVYRFGQPKCLITAGDFIECPLGPTWCQEANLKTSARPCNRHRASPDA